MAKVPQKGEPKSDQERPQIYVTRLGGRYVKADELLRSKRGREMVDAIADLDFNEDFSANHPTDG